MLKMMCLLLMSYGLLLQAGDSKEKRPTVAIGNFEWSVPINRDSKLITSEGQANNVMTTLRTQVITALTQTQKFEIIERAQIGQIVEELKLTHESGLVDPTIKNTPKWGKLRGVNWLVIGVLTQFNETGSGGMLGSKIGFSKRDLFLVFDVRVVDVESGRVVDAAPLEVKVPVGGSMGGSILAKNGLAGFSAQKGEPEQINELVRRTCTRMVHRIVANVSPIRVVQVRENEVLLSYGAGLLEKGDLLEVFTKGEVFMDPDTGAEEAELIAAGTLEVVLTQRIFSKAEPKKGTMVSNLKEGDICRVAEPKGLFGLKKKK